VASNKINYLEARSRLGSHSLGPACDPLYYVTLEPVYVDGLYAEGVINTGVNFMLPFFRYAPKQTESGVVLIRTAATLLACPHSTVQRPQIIGRAH
jgi:hypothetical protein